MPPRSRRRPHPSVLAAADVLPDGSVVRQYGGGDGDEERRTSCSSSGPTRSATRPRWRTRPSSILARAARAALLPAGYPASVTPDYAAFQAWDSLQGLCSYVRGVPSSAAVLAGLGLGRAQAAGGQAAAATPLSAMTTFFWRDAAAMAAGAALASAASLDAHAKQWRLAADAAASVALALDLASGVAGPAAFGPLVTAAGVARALCGVAGGATRAALTHHFSRGGGGNGGGTGSGNAADVAAKEGTQEAAVTLVGMAAGLALSRLGARSPAAAAALWIALTILHFYANIRAVRALRLTTVNRARAEVVCDDWFGGSTPRARRAPLSPDDANAAESLLPPPLAAAAGWCGLRRVDPVRLGVPLAAVADAAGVAPGDLLAGRAGRAVAVAADPGGAFWATPRAVALSTDASGPDALRGYAAARGLGAGLAPGEALKAAAGLVAGMEAAGWEVGRVALGGGGVRVAVKKRGVD
jgi:hypothetical protein